MRPNPKLNFPIMLTVVMAVLLPVSDSHAIDVSGKEFFEDLNPMNIPLIKELLYGARDTFKELVGHLSPINTAPTEQKGIPLLVYVAFIVLMVIILILLMQRGNGMAFWFFYFFVCLSITLLFGFWWPVFILGVPVFSVVRGVNRSSSKQYRPMHTTYHAASNPPVRPVQTIIRQTPSPRMHVVIAKENYKYHDDQKQDGHLIMSDRD